jgi:hypothetical protein
MMLKQDEMVKVFQPTFTPPQATVLARVITEAYTDLVKTSDFNELKAIVAELAAAQTAMAEAQQRTEQRMGELAAAQQRTEQAVQTLARGLKDTRAEVGGLSLSMSYALENEAYRAVPAFLASRYGIHLTERFVRTELDGEEINFFGHATQNGENIIIVGEVKLRLDDRRKVETEVGASLRSAALVELERKLAAVRRHYPDTPLVPLLVTHYARPIILQEATEQGVIIVQSFEW